MLAVVGEAYRKNEEGEAVEDFIVDLRDLDCAETQPGREKEEEEKGAWRPLGLVWSRRLVARNKGCRTYWRRVFGCASSRMGTGCWTRL